MKPVLDCDLLQVYDKCSHQLSRNIARTRTDERIVMKITFTCAYIFIRITAFRAMKGFWIWAQNEGIRLFACEAVQIKLTNAKSTEQNRGKMIHFFGIFKIHDLKEQRNGTLETLKLIFTEPLVIIGNENEKQKLMQIYHNDALLGEKVVG